MPAVTPYERLLYTCDVRTLCALTPASGNPDANYDPDFECGGQVPGVRDVYVGEWLTTWPGATNKPALLRGRWYNDAVNVITNLQAGDLVATSPEWHQLPARYRTLTFTETAERTDQGLRYLFTITAAWSSRKESALILADKLRGRKLRAIVEQADGRRLLVPTLMLTDSPYSAGTRGGDAHGYALTFTGYGLTPAYALDETAWAQQTIIYNP